jgi:UDP-glucuronate 4-epimerase
MRILVTGTAGFIGFHTARKLLRRGDEVVGVDSVNDYYDVRVKYGRLAACGISERDVEYGKPVKSSVYPAYTFVQSKLEDREAVERVFASGRFDAVINLAAQAGVRYSLTNPYAYIDSNILGFMNILECCRHAKVGHLVYASSSSVYGLNGKLPFSTHDSVDHPLSLYAATKKANELMAHTYSYLYGLPTTGLRFFTVYGPWGRPDMALFIFTKAIIEGRPIDVFNNGDMVRDFTYVDDIVEGVVRLADRVPVPNESWDNLRADPASSKAPFAVYNIGNSRPVKLLSYIEALEEALGKKAEKRFLPMQPGDVPATSADVSDLVRDIGYKPETTVRDGIARFVAWYREFYGGMNS